ncbi:MAG: hypothetical protein RIC12_01975, partial [Pirellulales bacterium]
MIGSTWVVDPVKILTRRELATVLDDLACRAPRSLSAYLNRVIYRLARSPSLKISRKRSAAKYTTSTASRFFVSEVASARAISGAAELAQMPLIGCRLPPSVRVAAAFPRFGDSGTAIRGVSR